MIKNPNVNFYQQTKGQIGLLYCISLLNDNSTSDTLVKKCIPPNL